MVARKTYNQWGIEITTWNKTNVVAYVDCDCGQLARRELGKYNHFKCSNWGPERLVGICIDKGYKFPLNQCFKAYLFFIFNSLKCLGIDNKSNLYSPRKVICSQLIGDTCFIYLVTSGSILTR